VVIRAPARPATRTSPPVRSAVPEGHAHLRSACGQVIPLHVPRWFDEPGPDERAALDEAVSPALDIGCGPGRHTLALNARGIETLGVDDAPASVRAARRRGAPVLHRSVFDPLPGEGSWGSVLLLDGNIGIGGDPAALLHRVRELLRPGGRALLELGPPGTATERLIVRPHAGAHGWLPWAASAKFDWATVGVDDLEHLSSGAGFRVDRAWNAGDRWFARVDAT